MDRAVWDRRVPVKRPRPRARQSLTRRARNIARNAHSDRPSPRRSTNEQGHSNKASRDGSYGFGSVFAEVFAGFPDSSSGFADGLDGGVSQGCERTGSGPDAAPVLVEGDVAHEMEPVFDAPMRAVEREQAFGRGLGGVQAGDQVDRFYARLALDFQRGFEARDLGRARPIKVRRGYGADADPARFDAAVTLADRSGPFVVRGRAVVDARGV